MQKRVSGQHRDFDVDPDHHPERSDGACHHRPPVAAPLQNGGCELGASDDGGEDHTGGDEVRERCHSNAVVFEVDADSGGTTWSVVLKGRAEMLPNDSAFTDRAAALLPHWMPTEPYLWVVILPDSIRGRSFEHRPPESASAA
ncbi:hypothetical protein HQQ80_17080 [Microbacteriaceae bacterium VKM Ac-2855]|nr:hypothetical protein [Microbacteriaceae bacterium VKM Ac-2855]